MQGSITLFSLFQLGGPVMWVLLALLILTTVIIIERIITWCNIDRNVQDGTAKALKLYTEEGKVSAIQFCDNPKHVWGPMAKTALECQGGRILSLEMAKLQGDKAVMKLDGPLPYLDTIASVAPILGFLGTVIGMITAFKSIAEANTVQLQLVASGLYQALFTTAFGLIIAVIATIASNIFRQSLQSYETRQENALATIESALRIN